MAEIWLLWFLVWEYGGRYDCVISIGIRSGKLNVCFQLSNLQWKHVIVKIWLLFVLFQ